MAFNLSTGLLNKLLGKQSAGTGDGFGGNMNLFVVDLYSGARPTSADAAPVGTLLITYTVNDDGVTRQV